MKKKLIKLNFEFGKDASKKEIVDSTADVLHAVIIVEDELGDGFQIADLFGLIKLQPIVEEVIQDGVKFLSELKNLKPELTMAAIDEARDVILTKGLKFGKVSSSVYFVLRAVAQSYGAADIAYQNALGVKVTFDKAFGGESANDE